MGISSDAVLARKLGELESALREAFVSRRNQETEEMREEGEREGGDGGIRKRIDFLRNLLCAEMESRPGSKPVHLYHIAERLARLEDAYERWADGGSPPEVGQSLDNVSTCSCTDSCFNEEEEEEEGGRESPILDDQRPTEPHVSFGLEKSGLDLSEGQSKKGVPARAAIFATAAVAVVAAVVAIFIHGFKEAERTIFLVPT